MRVHDRVVVDTSFWMARKTLLIEVVAPLRQDDLLSHFRGSFGIARAALVDQSALFWMLLHIFRFLLVDLFQLILQLLQARWVGILWFGTIQYCYCLLEF